MGYCGKLSGVMSVRTGNIMRSLLFIPGNRLDMLQKGLGFSSDVVVPDLEDSVPNAEKDDAREKWGEEQVHVWRRSYDIAPPSGESLKDTAERVLPYFQKEILPRLYDDKNILISAHGNSLRSLIMYIENLKPEEIIKKEIATGEPKIYSFNQGNFQPKR